MNEKAASKFDAAFGASQVCGLGPDPYRFKEGAVAALAGFFSALRFRAAVIFKGL